MKTILIGLIAMSSLNAFSAETKLLHFTDTLFCKGPKMFCFCDSEREVQKTLNESRECGDKELIITGLKSKKQFGEGDAFVVRGLYCSYEVKYTCE